MSEAVRRRGRTTGQAGTSAIWQLYYSFILLRYRVSGKTRVTNRLPRKGERKRCSIAALLQRDLDPACLCIKAGASRLWPVQTDLALWHTRCPQGIMHNQRPAARQFNIGSGVTL